MREQEDARDVLSTMRPTSRSLREVLPSLRIEHSRVGAVLRESCACARSREPRASRARAQTAKRRSCAGGGLFLFSPYLIAEMVIVCDFGVGSNTRTIC